jgi:autotransporter-associated beta strand protein
MKRPDSSLLSFPFIVRLLGVLTLAVSLPEQSAQAATQTWQNSGTDFNTAGNWSGGIPGSGDTARFNSAEGMQPNLSASLTIDQLQFTNAGVGYDLTSSNTGIKLTLMRIGTGGASAINAVNTTGTNTIDAPLVLGAAANSTQTFTQAGGGTLIVNGVISSTNSVTLSLAGAGIIQLGGANTYSGGTTLANGTTVRINNATALGTGTFTISGGTIDNTTAGAITLSNNNAQAWNGNFTFTGTQSLNLGTGAVTLSNSRIVTVNANNLTVGGVISGTGFGLTKTGNGTLTLSGANTYTGATTVNAGTLLVNGNNSAATGAVSVNNSGTTLGGAGTIGGAVTVGSGANLLGGTGSTASGALTLANNLTLTSGSIIELALGATSGAHSTLARSGVGTWTFNATQAFTLIDLGVVPGTTYNNIITGLASDPGSESNWAITNAGWSGSFSYASGNISLDVVAVPEPATWIAGALALGAVGWTQRRRFSPALKPT